MLKPSVANLGASKTEGIHQIFGLRCWLGSVYLARVRSQDHSQSSPGLYTLSFERVLKVTKVSSSPFPKSFCSKMQLLTISEFTATLWRTVYLFVVQYNKNVTECFGKD